MAATMRTQTKKSGAVAHVARRQHSSCIFVAKIMLFIEIIKK